jgi:ribosomal protein L7/L12
VAELEDRVEFLYRHLKLEFVADPIAANARVVAQIRAGNLIEAIKVYREIYNAGLAEAKTAVDRIKSDLGL